MTGSDSAIAFGASATSIPRILMSRRNLFRTASAVGAGAFLAACAGPASTTTTSTTSSTAAATGTGAVTSGATTGGAGAATGTLNVSLSRVLPTLDNKLNSYDSAITFFKAVRQGLTRIGDDLSPELVLAESFEATGDTEWTVVLKDGVTYSDGSALTVEDIDTALKNYFLVPAGYIASQFPEQPVVTKVDEKTFTLTSENPIVTLDSLMSNILITPAAANKAEDLQEGLGSGPFVITTADGGTGAYTLSPNENYWGEDKAQIAAVNVSYNEDESSRIIALQTGSIDVIDTLSADAATALANTDGVDLIQTPGTRLIHLFYNFRLPADNPISRPEVREALSYGVDHDTLISTLMAGLVSSAEGVVPKTLAGFVKTGEYAYDPEKAKSLLATAGVSNLTVRAIWEDSEFAGSAQVMEALVTMMSDIGVTLTLQQIPKGGEIQAWRYGDKSGDWDLLANGYGNQSGLALTNLAGQYAGTAEKEATKDTYQGFVVPEITDLVNQASQESDATKRDAILADAQQKIWDLWPAMWAWTPDNVLAKRSVVQNLSLRATNSYELSLVSVSG